jgi:hypothetical protein
MRLAMGGARRPRFHRFRHHLTLTLAKRRAGFYPAATIKSITACCIGYTNRFFLNLPLPPRH